MNSIDNKYLYTGEEEENEDDEDEENEDDEEVDYGFEGGDQETIDYFHTCMERDD